MVWSFFVFDVKKFDSSAKALGQDPRHSSYRELAVQVRLSDRRVGDLRIVRVDHSLQRILNGFEHVIVVQSYRHGVLVVNDRDLEATRGSRLARRPVAYR